MKKVFNKRAVTGSFTIDFWVIVAIIALLIIYIIVCALIKAGNTNTNGINFNFGGDAEYVALGDFLELSVAYNYVFSYRGEFEGKSQGLISVLESFNEMNKPAVKDYIKNLVESLGNGLFGISKNNYIIFCAKFSGLGADCDNFQYTEVGDYREMVFYFPEFKVLLRRNDA